MRMPQVAVAQPLFVEILKMPDDPSASYHSSGPVFVVEHPDYEYDD
jgi:hypothetical protein